MAQSLVGTSGWHYDHWKERFYPHGLPKAKWLSFYAEHFPTVELNASFYRLPKETTFTNWQETVPPDFRFAVKVSRFITHIKKLRDCEEPLQTFISRARLLGEKLGPLLYQLPPGLKRDNGLLGSFLFLLPGDLRHVFEFRSETWFDNSILELLRRHNAAFCIYDMPGLITPLVTTADFCYIRFHGSLHMYGGCYSEEELADWAKRIAAISHEVKETYIYFNNDAEGFALRNARKLTDSLKETRRI